jgi:hypothetical protein
MPQLLKHYWVDRDNPSIFATSLIQYSSSLFGVTLPNIDGLAIVYGLTDENGIEFFLSTCPDETEIIEVQGLSILTQQQWDSEISLYDNRQEDKRKIILRKYRNKLLNETDWVVIKAIELEENLSIEFKSWRQNLRDLPSQQNFAIELPPCPNGIAVDESIYTSYVNELRTIKMINDPLPEEILDSPGPTPE